jgi:hypothetical protein
MNEGKPKFSNDKAFNDRLKENGLIIHEAIKDILKETNMNELIKELEEDVRDCEKSVAQAKESLENEQKWLDREKLRLAEAIIRLHKEKYEGNKV